MRHTGGHRGTGTEQSSNAVLDWTHEVADLANAGLTHIRVASDDERQTIARELGLVACESLEARYDLRLRAGGRVELSGSISARVVQTCVVTLEPVEQTVEEPLEARYWPAADVAAAHEQGEPVGPTSQDEPEPIEVGRIDVGKLVFEHLATAIDPYPRTPGAQVDWQADDAMSEGAPAPGPFAALARLKVASEDSGR